MNVVMSITICNYAFLESFWQCCKKKWMLSSFHMALQYSLPTELIC